MGVVLSCGMGFMGQMPGWSLMRMTTGRTSGQETRRGSRPEDPSPVSRSSRWVARLNAKASGERYAAGQCAERHSGEGGRLEAEAWARA